MFSLWRPNVPKLLLPGKNTEQQMTFETIRWQNRNIDCRSHQFSYSKTYFVFNIMNKFLNLNTCSSNVRRLPYSHNITHGSETGSPIVLNSHISANASVPLMQVQLIPNSMTKLISHLNYLKTFRQRSRYK